MHDTKPTPLRTCPCGRAYTAPEWDALPMFPPVESEEESLEVRGCDCGAHLELVVAALLTPPLPSGR